MQKRRIIFDQNRLTELYLKEKPSISKTAAQLHKNHVVHRNLIDYRTSIRSTEKRSSPILLPIYTALTEDEALSALELFGEKWNAKYPLIDKSWQANWQRHQFNVRFAEGNSSRCLHDQCD